MEFDQMITLIKTVSDSHLTQFTYEEGSTKLSMKTDKGCKVMPLQNNVPVEYVGEKEIELPTTVTTGNVVKSPLVGVFYSASSPDTENFVKVGDQVSKGQVLGIVEAMKLMNEIECDFDGVVKEILVQNEEVVEYHQPMFVIE